ncbi:hypothetical protein NXY55_25790, partial [Aeromonas veronii]|nr:hypothetical protein [Aeromonas veronii]
TLAYCEGIEGFWELFGHSHHGLDFFFHSGIQIDQYGNINLHLVGDIEKPTFRGPGVANVSFGSSSKRIFLYTEKVTRRLFVPKVDFVSIPGHLDGPESKKLMGCKVNSGPCLCVTPMAVFDFDESTLRMRVRSVHKGYTLEELLENIGFTPLVSPNVTITPEPTEEELYHLRNIDKIGLLQ